MTKRQPTPDVIGKPLIDAVLCGLGSLLLLWMALAAQTSGKPGLPGQAASLDLKVLPKRGQSVPHISVRLRFSGNSGLITPEQAKKEGHGIIVDPPEDGARAYRISIPSGVGPDDELIVFVHDLNGRDETSPVIVKQTLVSRRDVPMKTVELDLDLAKPMHTYSLHRLTEGKLE